MTKHNEVISLPTTLMESVQKQHKVDDDVEAPLQIAGW